MAGRQHSVLFVCLGNICRSPMAEAVFRDIIKKRQIGSAWCVDSAAIIDYHVGRSPDKRTMQVLRQNGIADYAHIVRQVTSSDFETFDFIFGMDDDNISDLKDLAKMANAPKAKIELLGKYDPNKILIIPDPYYGNDIKDFEGVYDQCVRSCNGFLDVSNS